MAIFWKLHIFIKKKVAALVKCFTFNSNEREMRFIRTAHLQHCLLYELNFIVVLWLDFNSLEKIKEQQIQDYTNAKSPQLTFLPSISLVKSLPVRPSSCVRLATTSKDWSKVAMGGRQMQESIQPGYLVNLDDMKYIPRPLSARFHVGLACDREAGRPFQKYLETWVCL